MAPTPIKCRFLIEDLLQISEPQAITVSAIQDMPMELRNEWLQAIIEKVDLNKAGEDEEPFNFQSYILSLDGTVELRHDQFNANSLNAETETPLADYQPFEEVIAALRGVEQTTDQPINTTGQPELTRNTHHTDSLRLLHHVSHSDYRDRLETALGALAYGSIMSVAMLQRFIHQLSPAMRKRLQDLSVWIRAHPYLAAGLLSGITLSVLAIATPAILGAVGFSATGPVAGTLATAWQASIGSVVAGTPFALLQSAAMGGAAMGVVAGVGAAGAGVAAVSVLASNDTVRRVVKHVKSVVEREVFHVFVPNVKEFVEKEFLGVFVPNTQRFFEGLFGKKNDS